MDIQPIKQESKLFLSEISDAIWAVRAPLFVTILAALTLSIDQIQEILFLFAEETPVQGGRQIFLAGGLFLLFCLLLWRLSNDLLSVSRYRDEYMSRRARILRRILPVAIAVIPLFSLYSGLEEAYSTWSIIPTKSETGAPGAPKAPQVTATQIAEASKRAFNVRDRGLSAKHTIIRQELSNQLGNLAAPAKNLRKAATGTLIFASILVFAGLLFAIFGPERPLSGGETSVVPRSLRWKWLWISTFIFFLVLFALQSQGTSGPWGVIEAVPGWLGTSAIILLFFIYFTIFLSLLTRLYDRLEIPAISIILAVALLASYEDWNNNHAVRLVPREASNPHSLSATFAAWLKDLQEKHAGYVQKFVDKKQEYPVFLFALQGGGQYSSAFASLTLAKLFDRCPALRHHVFGLSSVSGGAVGAGFFAAQLKTELADPASSINSDRCGYDLGAMGQGANLGPVMGSLESKLSQLEQSDFLAPLASEALFGDFLQRFIPWPALPFLDRGRAFEAGLEGAWRRINPGKRSPLEADFLSHWSPSGGVPMLLLNTTRVQTGEPILAAPLLTRREAQTSVEVRTNAAELRTIYRDAITPGTSIRLSTAMSLSARFPLVTPVGRLHPEKQPAYFDLGDGGYFENSGAETVRVMLGELAFYKNYPRLFDPSGSLTSFLSILSFKSVVLNEVDPDSVEKQTLNELISPFEALYRARKQRGAMAINRLFSDGDLGVIRISHDPFPLPLGWRLSRSKQDLISAMVGTPNECDDSKPREVVRVAKLVADQYAAELTDLDKETRDAIGKRFGILFYQMHRNRCVLRDVVRDVAGD
jgi:hypothetical protein